MRAFVSFAFATLCASAAQASPWTLGQGELVVHAGFDHQYARREFLERGSARRFPLRGKYRSTNYRLGLRLGLTAQTELGLSLPFRQVSYQADPVILLGPTDMTGAAAFDYYQENVLALSREHSGVGDLELAVRHAWLKRSLAVATEVRIKTPTGYDAPSGTFGDEPRTEEQFLADPARFVSPDNVEDDVTLGDGQLDLSAAMLVGYGFSTGTFVRADAGYILRLAGAADQLTATLKVGQSIGSRFLVFIDSRAVLAVQSGRVIGISVAAEDPKLPAEDYQGLENLRLRELRLERDAIDVGGGVLYRVRDNVEAQVGYTRTAWGHNTALVHTLYTGISVRAELVP